MINLSKGQKLSLTKDTGTKKFIIGLGWEISAQPLDLDAVAFLTKNDGSTVTIPSESYFLFYNQKDATGGALVHSGDNRKGGSGDCEQIIVDFDKINSLDPSVNELSIFVTIFDAIKLKQNFGHLTSAYLRIYKEDGTEVANYDLDAQFPTALSVQIGSFDKDQSTGNWNFTAIGAGFDKELLDICKKYGLDVG